MVFVRSVFGVPNIQAYLDGYGIGWLGTGSAVPTWKGSLKARSVINGKILDLSENENASVNQNLDFDASKSSSVYINNAALRPQSISILALIRI